MVTKIKPAKLKTKPASVMPAMINGAQPSLTAEQRKRLQELTAEGAQIDDPFTQTLVNDLRQTIADHTRLVQQMQQWEQNLNIARDRVTKLEGQIDGYALTITKWESQNAKRTINESSLQS